MSLYCHECGSSSVRRAHFHFFPDALRLLTFHYPVRCRTCRRRWYVSMTDVRPLPKAPHRRENAPREGAPKVS